MKIKRLLSACIVIAGTTTLLISWKAQNTVSSTYESGSTVKVERYYTNAIQEEVMTLETEHTYKVGERELVGLTVSKLNVEEKEQKPLYEFTKEEIEILQKLAASETTDQSIDSMKNVVSTVINRVESKNFPDDIKSVVTQKGQFTSISDKRYYKVPITDDNIKAVEEVLMNGVTHDCLYFFNMRDISSTKIKSWINKKLEFVFKDDAGHSFYIEK